jgi:hypothetical protein
MILGRLGHFEGKQEEQERNEMVSMANKPSFFVVTHDSGGRGGFVEHPSRTYAAK